MMKCLTPTSTLLLAKHLNTVLGDFEVTDFTVNTTIHQGSTISIGGLKLSLLYPICESDTGMFSICLETGNIKKLLRMYKYLGYQHEMKIAIEKETLSK